MKGMMLAVLAALLAACVEQPVEQESADPTPRELADYVERVCGLPAPERTQEIERAREAGWSVNCP